MYQKILVGYDGSDASRKAFDTARNLALQHGAELWVIAVARPPEVGDGVETGDLVVVGEARALEVCAPAPRVDLQAGDRARRPAGSRGALSPC
jgi:nucleotide-binding universal stress UspA family protein